MKLEVVQEFLIKSDYKEKKFNREINKSEFEDILPFDNIFIDKHDSELYIIEEKESLFKKEEIEVFENNIFAFIQLLPNRNPLKYNINLLLLCPLQGESSRQEEVNYLIGLERNKYTCRKIVLDTSASNEDFKNNELSLLPSFPIKVDLTLSVSIRDSLGQQVKEVVNENLFSELIKDKEELVLENILNFLEVKEGK